MSSPDDGGATTPSSSDAADIDPSASEAQPVGQFVSYAKAAELLGVSTSTVSGLIVRGLLESRGQQGAGVGSLRRDQVETLRRDREEQRVAAEKRRAERLERPRGPQPPDRDHDWLRLFQAAEVVGVSPQAIRFQCVRGTLPAVVYQERWWIRRDHLELRQRARAAQASRSP